MSLKRLNTSGNYRWLIIIPLLIIPMFISAQTYSSQNEKSLNWSQASSWSGSDPNFLLGAITIQGRNIQINGTITADFDLSFNTNGNTELVVDNNDTLVVWGGFSVNGTSSVTVRVRSGGFLVVHGDFSIGTNANVSFDVNGGYLSVDGDFNQQGTANGGLNGNPHIYVTGTETGGYLECPTPSTYAPNSGTTCEYGNQTAIINNEDAQTRKFLLEALPLTITTTITQPTCNGGNNGQLIIQGHGGSYKYQYSLDGINWSPGYTAGSYTFPDLTAGTHTVYIQDDDTPQSSADFPVTIGQPDPLAVSFTGSKDITCVNISPNCTGVLAYSISGGTAPYTDITFYKNGASFEPGDLAKLCAGTYSIGVTDKNSCSFNSDDFTITYDNTPPSCNYVPEPEFILNTDFGILPQVIDTFENFTPAPLIGNGNRQVFGPFPLSSTSFNSIQLQLLATKTGIWVNTDTIRVEVSYNGTTWNSVLQSVGSGAIPNNLNGLNNNATNILYRVVFHSGHNCSIEHLYVRGNNIAKAISTSGPSDCTDNLSAVTYSPPSDGSINWICTNPLEFSFTRSWTVSDGCNSQDYDQIITVGDKPKFDGTLEPLTFDFCYNTPVNIDAPDVSDNCGVPAVSWFIRDNESGADLGIPGNGSIVGFTFPQPVLNDTIYVITWTVTDGAGLTESATQNVTIKRPMQIALSPLGQNFCTGESVSFDFSVSGGTGLYVNPPLFNPAGGSWVGNTYTTSGLNLLPLGPENIQVTYTDQNNGGVTGGCSTSQTFYNNGTDYKIHQKITTGAINRE